MLTFNGNVKNLAGEFRTWYELIVAAIQARTWLDATQKASTKNMWRGAAAMQMFIRSQGGNLYVMDAWKGVINGVTDQTKWTAAEFSGAGPGTAQVLDGGIWYPSNFRIELASRLVYTVADTIIDLDVTCFP